MSGLATNNGEEEFYAQLEFDFYNADDVVLGDKTIDAEGTGLAGAIEPGETVKWEMEWGGEVEELARYEMVKVA